MALVSREIHELILEARAAVQEALASGRLASAWELLQERDAEGNAQGPRPYTEQALAEFEAAYQLDPNDVGVAHHLAIAHHARAWDLELLNDPQAAPAWEKALGYWRILAESREFWAGLEAKLLSCDPNADPSLASESQRNLFDHLLEAHADFARHYCEKDEPSRAAAHVEIVERANIPPAVKPRFIERLFVPLEDVVPKAKAKQDYASALLVIKRLLAPQPLANYLPALRTYAEVCADQVSELSFQDDWEEILRLSEEALEYARRLASHPEIGDDPSAKTALEEMASKFTVHANARGNAFYDALKAGTGGTADRDAAKASFELGIEWGRLGRRHTLSGASVEKTLAACLYNHALCLNLEAEAVVASEVGAVKTRATAATRLFNEAIANLKEGQEYAPDDEDFPRFLQELRGRLLSLEFARFDL